MTKVCVCVRVRCMNVPLDYSSLQPDVPLIGGESSRNKQMTRMALREAWQPLFQPSAAAACDTVDLCLPTLNAADSKFVQTTIKVHPLVNSFPIDLLQDHAPKRSVSTQTTLQPFHCKHSLTSHQPQAKL